MVDRRSEVFDGAVGEVVDSADDVAAIEESFGQVRAHEARNAGYRYSHKPQSTEGRP